MARYLGLEITDGQVKGVVLRAAYRKLSVESVERIARLPGREGLAAAVRTILEAVGGTIDATYAALPGTDASMRLIELPRAVLKRGPRMVATSLEGALPFDLEDAIVDSQVTRPGEPTELLAVAARTERVTEFVETLREAGADPREVGIGPVALGELGGFVPELSVAGPVMLVHAYESLADVVVLANGRVLLARTIGGQTTEKARVRGLRQTMAAYMAGGGKAPDRAYLFGEAASLELDAVADAVGLAPENVFVTLPLGPIEVSPAVPVSAVHLSPLALALALRGIGRGARIDLRKGSLAVTGGSQALRERSGLLTSLAGMILVSWGLATAARYQSLSQERDRLVKALGDVTMEVFSERVTDPARARSLALGNTTGDETDPLPLADAYDVIGVMSQRIPAGIPNDVGQLDVADERVQIQGLVDNLQHRDQIVDALRGYECFPTVTPGRAQLNPGDQRQQYTVDITLRCPERAQPERRTGTSANGTPGAGTGSTTGGASGTTR